MEIPNCKLCKHWRTQEGHTVGRHLVGSILLWKPGFSPCGICGKQSGTETGCSLRTCQYHPLCAVHFSLSGTIQPVSTIPSVLPTAVCLALFTLSVPSPLCCPLRSVWHHSACQYHPLCAAHCGLSGTIQPVSTIPSVLPIAVCLAPFSLSVPSPLCCPFQSVWHHSACQYHPLCAAHCSLSGTI